VEEPEVLSTKNGKLWVRLLIEVRSWRRGADGEAGQEEVTKLPVNMFSKTAEIARDYLRVGDAVGLTCRVGGTEYKGTDGKTRRGITLAADQLHLIPQGKLSSSDTSKASARTPRKSAPTKEPRDWNRPPVMRPVGVDENNEPRDIPF
jgi:single-stranded DNA-binding protein